MPQVQNIANSVQANAESNTQVESCVHCGLDCPTPPIEDKGKFFCCMGCATVFDIIHANGLQQYYRLEKTPGTPPSKRQIEYSYLDTPEVREKILEFQGDKISKVRFYIPTIHCASCVWLLENLYQMHPEIRSTQVNFMKREVVINYSTATPLSEIVSLLANIGYEPLINLDSLEKQNQTSNSRDIIRIGIAGFCFGNVMLYSFPEYLAGDDVPKNFQVFFSYMCLLVSLPAFFYSGLPWLTASLRALRHRFLTIDVPIALGLTTLFVHSTWEIVSQTGQGYFDSLCGFIFFLLIGKFFQRKTFDTLSFDRDYKAYFPLSIQKETNDGEKQTIPIGDLKEGDTIIIRSQEVIPADGQLLSEEANIDYSFITGESDAIIRHQNDEIVAGGRVIGSSIRVTVKKKVSESFLAGIWSQTDKQRNVTKVNLIEKVSPYFTLAVIAIACLSFAAWLSLSSLAMAVYVFSSILIVACPCALALSAPFTYGAITRVLARSGIFIKDGKVLEYLHETTDIVFDKTGTLTTSGARLNYLYGGLTAEESQWVLSLARQSIHPISRALVNLLDGCRSFPPEEFHEISGKGVCGKVQGHSIVFGSWKWGSSQAVTISPEIPSIENNAHVFTIVVDGELRAILEVQSIFRTCWEKVVCMLKNSYSTHMLSGDSSREKTIVESAFEPSKMHFECSPFTKSDYVKSLQKEKKSVVMIGDGLNDAGALLCSDVAIAVVEDTSHFSPASDVIILGDSFSQIPALLKIADATHWIIRQSFVMSVVYNLIGLGFAISGNLSPLVAAILMPLSSISVMVFTVTMAKSAGRKYFNLSVEQTKG